MAGLADFQIPPPGRWEAFEDLCLDLWRHLWDDRNAQKNGRQGQPQHGVDIFGRPAGGATWAGVQCKGKNDALNSVLSEKELLAEVEKAREFKPPLSSLTVACTGPRNANIQKRARLITNSHEQQGLFSVHVWYWDDILERLNDWPDVISRHFPHFCPVKTYSIPNSDNPRKPSGGPSPRNEAALQAFAQPTPGSRMLQRGALAQHLEKSITAECSVYLNAPSGYGKSVLLSQLKLPNALWIDCRDDYRDFTQFRRHLRRFIRVKIPRTVMPDAPRELAHAMDKLVASAGEERLILAIDHIDGVDNGVKAFLEELVGLGNNIRVIVTGSSFKFKRQRSLQSAGRLRVVPAQDLAFIQRDTVAIVTAPLEGSGAMPSPEFARFIHHVTDGWPIAVQLVRARWEREPDESTIIRSLGNLIRDELGPYLLESYWQTLDDVLRSLLITTSILKMFDRSDAEALLPGRDLERAWGDLTSLPFVVHVPGSLLQYQPLFNTFLVDRLATEVDADYRRQMHRSAAIHFLDSKHVPPAAHYHAQRSGDQGLAIRAAGAMAEDAFFMGNYVLMGAVLDDLTPPVRWDDATLAVYQGRLYENKHDWSSALKWYRRAQQLFEKHGPEFWRIGITSDIGGILRKTDRPEEAVSLYNAALARLQQGETSIERGRLLANRANALLEQHLLQEAEEGFLQAEEIFDLHKDAHCLGRLYLSLSHLAKERHQPDPSFGLLLKALRYAGKSHDASLFLTIAGPCGQELLDRRKYSAARRIYRKALDAAVEADSPAQLPYILNNLGLACAFMPEPNREGVEALLTAREMKQMAGIPYGGTVQNLTTLLMRLGEFEKALPYAREQVQAAEAANDLDLTIDGKTRLAELQSIVARSANSDKNESKYSAGIRRMIFEGYLRLTLGDRGPLFRDVISMKGENESEQSEINIEGTTFHLCDAQTVLFVVKDETDLDRLDASSSHATSASSTSHSRNFILELIWQKSTVSGQEVSSPEAELAALWWIHAGNRMFVQAIGHERRADQSSIIALKGCLFTLDPTTELWGVADNEKNCDCGRPEVHDQLRRLAIVLADTYLKGAHTKHFVLAGTSYPVVSLPSTN